MTVVDISNPASPTVTGAVHDSAHLFGSYGVAVSGHYAFVAYQGLLGGQPTAPDTSTGGFSVIDLNNLAAGVVANIDNVSLPAPWTNSNALHHATSVAISGNYAYVTAFSGAAVTVIDISNPTSPAIVASLKDTTNLPLPVDAAASGQYLYVAQQTGSTHQLAILDISHPQAPTVVGTLGSSLLNNAYRIRVRGSFAYLAAKNSSSVVAVDVSDPKHPRLAGYLQDAGHLFSTSGLDVDTSGRYVVANSPELSTESGLNGVYPPFTPTTGTISVIDMIPNPIGVTIAPASEPANPTTQTSASFSFATTDDVSTVACARDTASFSACTSPTTQTYSGLSIGSHTFTVQTTDAAGHTATDSYTWTINPPAPTNSAVPTISGTAAQGQTLTVVHGTWTNSPTSYTDQWADCDSAGANCTVVATGPTYTLTATDVGHTIVVQESATNAGGTGGPVNSSHTSVVSAPPPAKPTNTALPTISGTAAQGQTLTVVHGTWTNSPTSYTDQWADCDSAGANCTVVATGPTYTLTATDVGHTIVVQESATNAGGTGGPVNSSHTSVVSAPPPAKPTNTALPTISGSPVNASTLSRGVGSWTGNPTSFPTQWEQCNSAGGACAAIPAATGQSYKLGAANVGHTIRVMVWAVNPGGQSAPATSAPTAVVTPTGPSAAAIVAALKTVLAPRGKASRIPALLHARSYKFWFAAPGAGRLALSWYFLPKGAHLTGASKGHPSPIKVATVTASLSKAGKVYLTLRLTSAGKKLLKPTQKLTLTAKASFTGPGGAAIVAPLKRFTLWRH